MKSRHKREEGTPNTESSREIGHGPGSHRGRETQEARRRRLRELLDSDDEERVRDHVTDSCSFLSHTLYTEMVERVRDHVTQSRH